MKRKTKTPRKQLEKKLDALILEKLKARYEKTCQLCRKPSNRLGRFHVLPKGAFPNMKYRPENLLWVCWHPCHFNWHHDFIKARDIVEPKIKVLLGDNYEDRLKTLSACIGKTTLDDLEKLYAWWSNY